MPGAPIPTQELANLVNVLGEESVRSLVRTFLAEYPSLLHQLGSGDRNTQHRMAHSLKSNARIIGAQALSMRLAALEQRLGTDPGADVSPTEFASLSAAFDELAQSLRAFAK